MSLVVAVDGQFKPYPPTELKSNSLNIRKTTPVFNKLLNKYLEENKSTNSSEVKEKVETRKNTKLKAYEDESKSFTRQFYARDIMSSGVQFLGVENTILDAIQLMDSKGFHHIPIVKENVMVGIISDRLILKTMAEGSNLKTPIEEFMNVEVLTAQLHSSITDVARAMLVEKINCLPVIDNNLNIKGIITTSDMLSHITTDHLFETRA